VLAELKQSGFADPQEQKLAEQQQRVTAKNRFLLARALLDAGELALAKSILTELHAGAPADWPIAEMLIESLLISGDSAAASNLLANLPEHTGDSAWRHLTRGRVELNKARPNNALPHFLKAQEAAPGNARAKIFLGQTYLALRRWPEARRAFEAALAVESSHPEALFGLTIVANKQARFEEAIAIATQALASQELPLAYYHRGYALLKLGRTANATEDFRQVLNLLPNFLPAKRFLIKGTLPRLFDT
jgi:tetratricopeptide (TPR) repeat protein